MPEKFDPKQFESFEKLPEDQKPNFKKVKGGFVYKKALSKKEAIVEAEKIKDNLSDNAYEKEKTETLAEADAKGYKRKFHWEWSDRKLNSDIEKIKNIHPEGLASLIYAPTEAELKECEKNGNIILPHNLPVVITAENSTEEDNEERKKLLKQWRDAVKLYNENLGEFNSVYRIHQRNYNTVGETFERYMSNLEASLQKFYGNHDGLFDNIRGKKIVELAAGQSVVATFPHSGGMYQTQPIISRVLAYCSDKLGLNAEVMAVDLGIDPIIESKYGVNALREYFDNLPYILDEKEKPDIVIMNNWEPQRGAIPQIFKQNTVYCVTDSVSRDGISDTIESGFHGSGNEMDGVIFWKDPSYQPTVQESNLEVIKKELYLSSKKGFFPNHIESFSLDKAFLHFTNPEDYDLSFKIEIEKIGEYELIEQNIRDPLILAEEDCWPVRKNDNKPELIYPNKELPLFFDVGHVGEAHDIMPKKSTLYKYNSETGKTEKILEVNFPDRISISFDGKLKKSSK